MVENVHAWVRQLDNEHIPGAQAAFRTCDVWLLGFKTENAPCSSTPPAARGSRFWAASTTSWATTPAGDTAAGTLVIALGVQ